LSSYISEDLIKFITLSIKDVLKFLCIAEGCIIMNTSINVLWNGNHSNFLKVLANLIWTNARENNDSAMISIGFFMDNRVIV